MDVVFWLLEIAGWILLIIPVIKKQKMEKEECRKFCRCGCGAGIVATLLFAIEMYRRNNAMMNGDISQQLLVMLLSITLIPLGIYLIIFVYSYIIRK